MKPSISALTLVHALVAAALLYVGLDAWDITILTACAVVVTGGVIASAIGLGSMANPMAAMQLVDYMPQLKTDIAPATAVFYLILALASSGWAFWFMAIFAIQSGVVWFTRKD